MVGLADGRLAEARRAALALARLSRLNAPAALPVAARTSAWTRDAAGLRDDLAAIQANGVRGSLVTIRRTAIGASLAALEGRADEGRRLFAEAQRGLLDAGVAFEAALVAIDAAVTLGPDDPAAVEAAGAARPILERLGARPFLAMLDRS